MKPTFIFTDTGCTDGSDNDCCTTSNLCGIGDGDCDSDDQCQGDLICGSNNCDTSLGFGSEWDCCYDPIADLWNANWNPLAIQCSKFGDED